MSFPVSPSNGDTHVVTGVGTYQYVSATNSWKFLGGSGAHITSGPAFPVTPQSGDIHRYTTNDRTYQFEVDAWIDITSGGFGLESEYVNQNLVINADFNSWQEGTSFAAIANGGKVLKPKLVLEKKTEIKRKIYLPKSIRNTILEGMDRVLWGEKGSARFLTIQKLDLIIK